MFFSKQSLTKCIGLMLLVIFLTAGFVTKKILLDQVFADYTLRSPALSEVDAWPGFSVQLNDEVIVTADTTDNSLWYSFTPLRSGDYSFDTCDEGTLETYMTLYQANDPDDFNELIYLAENDNTGSPCTNSLSSRIDRTLTAGQKYYVQIDISDIGDVRFVLHSDDPAVVVPTIANANDWPGFEIFAGESFQLDNATANMQVDEPLAGVIYRSIWYKFVPTESGMYTADTCDDASSDTYMALYEAGSPDEMANLVSITENDDTAGVCSNTQASSIESNLASGTTYYYQVGSNGSGVSGNIMFNLSGVTQPVVTSLTLDQKSLFATAQGNFSFTGSAAAGSGIAAVRWRNFISGQDPAAGWTTCTAQDGNFNGTTEAFTCAIPTGATDGQFHFEVSATTAGDTTLDSVYATAMLDIAKNIDLWLNFTNASNIGTHPGDSRSIGALSVNGTPTLSTGLYNDGALSFDGTDSFEIADTTPYFDYAGADRSFSLNARFWPATAGDNTERSIFVKNWPGTPETSYWTLKLNADNSLAATISIGTVANTLTTDAASVELDSWNSIKLSFDVGKRVMCLKINDQRTKCQAWIQSDELLPSNYPLIIGTDFVGLIDDIYLSRSTDASPPVITLAGLDTAERVTTATPTFTGTMTDVGGGVAGAEYCLTVPDVDCSSWSTIAAPVDGSWGGASESISVTVPSRTDGTHIFTVRGTDLVGNASTDFYYYTSTFFQASYTFTVETIDTTAPRIYTNTISPDPGSESRPIIRGYVKDYLVLGEGDTISNIASISYSIDDGQFLPISPIDGSYNANREDFYYQIPTDLAVGAHTIQIRATDSAANSTSANTVNATLGDVRISFTVLEADPAEPAQELSTVISFDNHDAHDSIYSDAVWGNGIVRLRQEIDFTGTVDYAPASHDVFGYTYGASYIGVYPSLDGNMWIAGNDGSVTYYNSTSQTATVYDKDLLQGAGTTINKIYEFLDGGNKYLLISYSSSTASIIYDLKNTPANTADDSTPAVAISSITGFLSGYNRFVAQGTDTRAATVALYGLIEGAANNVMRLDLNGTPMNLTDDTFTVWGQAEGSAVSGVGAYLGTYTSFYFDQTEHLFIGSHYTGGMFVCDDNNTPTNKADDDCTAPTDPGAVSVAGRVFSIIKDPNDWYWFGGDNGIQRVNFNGTTLRSDDTVHWALETANIAGDDISSLAWVAGDYPVGDEIWAMTRQGRIRAVEYNSTYSDFYDDTTYSYKIDNFDFRAGGSSTFYMQNDNTIWVPVPGAGLEKVALARDYADQNSIEIYLTTPEQLLEVNHFLLESVTGSVSAGSLYNFGDLVTYQISNDAGITWRTLAVGELIDFTNSNYKLKLKITLHKGSTPILESVSLSYTAQPEGTIIVSGGDDTSSSSSSSSSSSGSVTSADCGVSISADSPDLFEITSTGTSATVYFAPPSGDYSYFYVSYGENSDAVQHGVQFAHGKSTGVIGFQINDLRPNTTYYFKVRSGHGCAIGNWSNRMKITTPKTQNQKRSYYKNFIVRVTQTIKKLFNAESPLPVNVAAPEPSVAPHSSPVAQPAPQPQPAPSEPEKRCFLWWCW